MRDGAVRAFSRVGVLLFSAGLVLSACKSQKDTEAGNVISAFQGSCATTGQWTQSAIANSQALIGVMESLKASDACKPFISTLSTIQGLSSQINNLLVNQDYSNYRISEENLQQLTLALNGATPGSDIASQLGTAVVNAQVSLAEARATNDVNDNAALRNQYVASTQQLATLMQGILGDTSSGLAACLQQSPAASVELANNFLAIGGSFFSPIVGAGAELMGQLLNTAVEYIRNAGTESAIYQLYEAQMPVALGCGLESMSELYCSANDAFDLLSIQAQAYPAPGQSPLPIWEGMDFLNRRLPILTNWLESVKNGVLPVDPIDAQRQNAIWTKLQELDDYSRTVYATFSNQQRVYNSATDASQKHDILVNTIISVAQTLAPNSCCSPSDPNNPFADKSNDPQDFACWLVWGPNTADCKKQDASHPNGYPTLKDYINQALLAAVPNADFNLLNKDWSNLFTVVNNLIVLEFSQTITADPQSLLAAARQGITPDNTPRHVLDMLLKFLQDMLNEDDGTNPQLPTLIHDTQKMILNVDTVLDDTTCVDSQGNPIDCGIKRLQQISQVFETFQLSKSLQFFVDRINNFVEWDLEYKIRHGEIPSNIQDILLSAGTDLRNRLQAAGMMNDLTTMVQDLNKSRSIVQGNLAVFRGFFGDSLGRSVEALHKAAVEAGEPDEGPNRPNGQTLAQLCTLVLATGRDWPQKVSWDICSKAVLSSIYPDPKGDLSIHVGKLKQDLDQKPFDYRVCAFHRFLRAGRLAEVLHDSPSPNPSPSPSLGLLDRAWY